MYWEIREKAAEIDVETIVQRAREKHPDEQPRLITDNGPQFIAKEFIRVAGMTHVKTSPYDPQSKGKIERRHKTLKGDGLRPKAPLSAEDARRLVTDFVASPKATLKKRLLSGAAASTIKIDNTGTASYPEWLRERALRSHSNRFPTRRERQVLTPARYDRGR